MSRDANVKITNELKNPSELGTHYRLLCMTGPNKGKVYYLTGKRIIIGRGENADILIVDTKISREHAELSFAEKNYTITDLGAQNGVIVNDAKIKQKKLLDNEKIVIGQTVFKYNIIEITNSEVALLDEKGSALAIKDLAKANKRATGKNASNEPSSGPSKKTSGQGTKGPPKVIIFALLIIGVLFVLMDNGDKPKTESTKNAASTTDFDKDFNQGLGKKNVMEDPEVKKKLEALIHSGRREFSEGNYFRAIEDFRLALLLSPNNGHASFYLSKAKQSLDDDIKKNFDKGKQEYESKKYQAAIVSYCGVVQLIQNYPNDERYKNAMSQISAIESELGQEKGEIKCFETKPTESKN
jgi:pSer/pThr/pTyr-binding forkhead associated (FHA) protein